VSSPYGQFSIAGFAKPHSFWYRANWLAGRPVGPGRPMQPVLHVARVLELADQLEPAAHGFTVRAVTDSPVAELFVDGQSQGRQPTSGIYPSQVEMVTWVANVSAPSCSFPINRSIDQCRGLERNLDARSPAECRAACCKAVECNTWQFNGEGGCWIGDTDASRCEPGKRVWVGGSRSIEPTSANLTVIGRGTNGTIESSHTIVVPGRAARLGMYLDAPSPASGTGSSLVLDGKDVALVRVALEDAFGTLVSAVDVNVTMSVFSGPARLVGVASGDPASHCPPHGDTCETYAGLVRGVVQVTTDCMTPNRQVLGSISRDANAHTIIAGEGTGKLCPSGPIVLGATATVNGTEVSGSISIGVSTSPDDSPVSVARSSARANLDVGAWLTDYQG